MPIIKLQCSYSPSAVHKHSSQPFFSYILTCPSACSTPAKVLSTHLAETEAFVHGVKGVLCRLSVCELHEAVGIAGHLRGGTGGAQAGGNYADEINYLTKQGLCTHPF